MENIENIRFIASASKNSKSHTERILSRALLEMADDFERLRERQREATALVGKLSFELSDANKENRRLIAAMSALSIPQKRAR